MKSLWSDEEAAQFGNDPLSLRVYTSRLLGRDASLVLHGGGNTSVKATATNILGDEEEVLYVKGSGWDLVSIEAAGFAPVRLDVLKRMARLESLSDSEMVRGQRAAMTDPFAPNPSVEAILHAIIPFKYVDHTHTDAVVTVSNTPDGEARIRELYGERVLVIPYVMPGFILAKTIFELLQDVDVSKLDGMVLLNHGLFTFSDDARQSYEMMIELVSMAEDYLEKHAPLAWQPATASEDLPALARMRRAVSELRGAAMVARVDTGAAAVAFSNRGDVADISTRGTLTPDHVIRTKPTPVIIGEEASASVASYGDRYRSYFERNTDGSLTCLDVAPRWAIWPGHGCVGFGRSVKEADIIGDIRDHTLPAIVRAEAMGDWTPVGEHDLFELEYWELEQAKLKKGGSAPALQGKIALVTGAASGIGKACAEALLDAGVAVAALDIDPKVTEIFDRPDSLGIVCDVRERGALKQAVAATVRAFGGLDILVSNAGMFPAGAPVEEIDAEVWEKSVAVNLSSHQALFAAAIPYLKLGVDPAIVVIASKNVPAPGPGAAAYSAAKAGLTQLARVAALELAPSGVRVNMLHPNAVFDTGIWTPEVLENRAKHYGMTVQEYKTRNLMKVEVTSRDVADLTVAMAGPLFAKTTGAQLPVDGGDDRVI